ncbi:MAG: sugar ABC transporter permease [Hungatella sp.]|jgi:putative aldouronate transport system permease protein|nr:sugar ABC transporter permease [Hungatella sp.]
MGIRMQKAIRKDWQLFIMCLLPVIYYIVFHYIPMYGVQIAFKDFYASKGIWGSQWVGMKYFKRFFHSYQFWPLIRNTLSLSFLQIAVGFPAPIILAILLNQMKNQRFKQFVQTVTYCPHFISIVVLTGMLSVFLSPRSGLINNLIAFLGGEPKFFLGEPGWFRPIFVLSGVWQNAGWSAIIYIAALGGISWDLYEAAKMDGASKWQIVRHIDIPGLMPTVTMMLIMEMGKVMNIGFQKAYLMQNGLNISASEIIPTYIYKIGLIDAQYSYSAAISLFNNLINIILLVTVNKIAQKTGENSLW